MTNPQQEEFFLGERAGDRIQPADTLADFVAEVAARWGLPLGQRVCIRLFNSVVPELSGKLQLAKAPDLPLDAREVLRLRIAGVEFSHREIASWALI